MSLGQFTLDTVSGSGRGAIYDLTPPSSPLELTSDVITCTECIVGSTMSRGTKGVIPHRTNTLETNISTHFESFSLN